MHRGMHSGKQWKTVENSGKQGKTVEKGALNGYEMALEWILGVNLGPPPQQIPRGFPEGPQGGPP